MSNEVKNKKLQPQRRRRFGLIDILISIVLLLILLMIFTAAMVITYPKAAKNIADVILSPSGGLGKALSMIGNRAREGFTYRIRPLLSGTVDYFTPKKQVKGKVPLVTADDFKECLKCHPDVFVKETTNHLRVKHLLHEAAQVGCSVCHITKHLKKLTVRPLTVKEVTCLNCHKNKKTSLDCQTCHAPGSISQVIAKEKIEIFLANRTVSQKMLVPQGFEHPVGDKNEPCKQCHKLSEFCVRCHTAAPNGILSSPHDSNWIPSHGPRIFKGELSTTDCWQCHNNLFCAGACHPNPNRQRINPNWPLPKVELE